MLSALLSMLFPPPPVRVYGTLADLRAMCKDESDLVTLSADEEVRAEIRVYTRLLVKSLPAEQVAEHTFKFMIHGPNWMGGGSGNPLYGDHELLLKAWNLHVLDDTRDIREAGSATEVAWVNDEITVQFALGPAFYRKT